MRVDRWKKVISEQLNLSMTAYSDEKELPVELFVNPREDELQFSWEDDSGGMWYLLLPSDTVITLAALFE